MYNKNMEKEKAGAPDKGSQAAFFLIIGGALIASIVGLMAMILRG